MAQVFALGGRTMAAIKVSENEKVNMASGPTLV